MTCLSVYQLVSRCKLIPTLLGIRQVDFNVEVMISCIILSVKVALTMQYSSYGGRRYKLGRKCTFENVFFKMVESVVETKHYHVFKKFKRTMMVGNRFLVGQPLVIYDHVLGITEKYCSSISFSLVIGAVYQPLEWIYSFA
jgi:hypothetical protein